MRPMRMIGVLIGVTICALAVANGCGKTNTDGNRVGSGGTATAASDGAAGMTAGSGGHGSGEAGGDSKASGGATSTGGISGTGGSSIACPVGGECRVEYGRCVCFGGLGGAPGTGGATSAGGISGAGGSSIVCIGCVGGAPGTGGARTMDAGLSACQTIDALDRSCVADTDCIAVKHRSNCCGQIRYIGIRDTEKARFDANEAACDASYPACGCAANAPSMDDGSVDIRQTVQPGVKCQLGACTTFVRDCAKPCPAGTACVTCTTAALWFGACTVPCVTSSDCPSKLGMPSCKTVNGTTGNTNGSFCAYEDTRCDSN